jgi:hypothetical protein
MNQNEPQDKAYEAPVVEDLSVDAGPASVQAGLTTPPPPVS